MKKTYWWRIITFIIGVSGTIAGYAIFYPHKYGLCISSEKNCIFSQFKKTLAEPLFFLALSLVLVSIFLFFVNDNIFKKWLRIAIIWFIINIALITISPTYTGGWINFGPTKELVSIWMGVLFVIISLVLIIWQVIKERKK